MNAQHISHELGKVIKTLSDPKSYESSYHHPLKNQEILSVNAIKEIVDLTREILFPGFFGNQAIKPDSMKYYLGVNVDNLYKLLVRQINNGFCFNCDNQFDASCNECKADGDSIALKYIEQLPFLREKLSKDVHATFLNDPAAKSYGEIIFAYPGIKAITNYRIANSFFKLGVPIIPRIISEMAHSETGIDIHPGASIGDYFTIDHGTGIVIGETCIIGNNVMLYQGVTLGAKSFPVDAQGNPIKGIPRHPIVEDEVTIYSHATILGRITIGKGSVVGGNVWVTYDLPPYSKIIQQRAKENMFSDGGGI